MSGKCIQKTFAVLAAILLHVSSPHRCTAALIIDVQDAYLQAGSVGFVEVFIRSTDVDELQLVSYKFQIEMINGTGSLEFLPGTNTFEVPRQSKSEQDDANYLFHGDTDPAFFSTDRLDPDLDLAAGGDSTSSGENVTITDANRLLVRLELQHVTPTPLSSVGEYRVSLVNDIGFNEFTNALGDPVPLDLSSFSNYGTVNVVGTPEPSSAVLLAFGFCGVAMWRRLFRRPAINVKPFLKVF